MNEGEGLLEIRALVDQSDGLLALFYNVDARHCEVTYVADGFSKTVALDPSEVLRLVELTVYLEPATMGIAGADEALDDLFSSGFRALIGPFQLALERANPKRILICESIRSVTSRIPFHLLLDDAGRRLGERFHVAYRPDVTTVRVSGRPPATRPVTILTDPRADLPIPRAFAERWRQRGFETATQEAVTSDELFSRLAEPGSLILCCHAENSQLLLADGPVGLRECHERLAVCEREFVALVVCKGAQRTQLTLETLFYSFPRILLEAGARVVASSRWELPQLSSVLQVDELVTSLHAGLSPIESLRGAAKRIRSMSNAELRASVELLTTELADLPDLAAWLTMALAKDGAARAIANERSQFLRTVAEAEIFLRRRALNEGQRFVARLPLDSLKDVRKRAAILPWPEDAQSPAFPEPTDWGSLLHFTLT